MCARSKAPFQRLVRELAETYKADLHFTGNSVIALQEATEAFMVDWFADVNRLAIHHGRQTIMKRDVETLEMIQVPGDW